MAQQTAVEWLMEKYFSRQVYEESIWDEEFEQAKAMEKEQIMESWKHGKLPTFLGRVLTAEEYYNEIYTQCNE